MRLPTPPLHPLKVRPTAPRPADFALMHGRGGSGGGGGPFDPVATRLLDYHVEDIPLSVLAGHRTAPRGPDFRTTKPHAALDAIGKGQGYSLSPLSVLQGCGARLHMPCSLF